MAHLKPKMRLYIAKYCTMTKLTKEIVNERIYERGISLIGEFTYSRIKSLFKCSHDHEWFATPDSVMRSNGCPDGYTETLSLNLLEDVKRTLL
jgi:hypothetical protein